MTNSQTVLVVGKQGAQTVHLATPRQELTAEEKAMCKALALDLAAAFARSKKEGAE